MKKKIYISLNIEAIFFREESVLAVQACYQWCNQKKLTLHIGSHKSN